MSAFALKVKDFFDKGLWTLDRVKNAVLKGAVTIEEYTAITGEEYNQ